MDLWSCDTVHSKIHRTPYCDGHRSEVRLSGRVCLPIELAREHNVLRLFKVWGLHIQGQCCTSVEAYRHIW